VDAVAFGQLAKSLTMLVGDYGDYGDSTTTATRRCTTSW